MATQTSRQHFKSETIMIDNWSTERTVSLSISCVCLTATIHRTPVMVFLSDGQSSVKEKTVIHLCRSSATRHGWITLHHFRRIANELVRKPLSFHAVSFGPNGESASTITVARCPPTDSSASPSHFSPHLFGISSSRSCDASGQNNLTLTLRNMVKIFQYSSRYGE